MHELDKFNVRQIERKFIEFYFCLRSLIGRVGDS